MKKKSIFIVALLICVLCTDPSVSEASNNFNIKSTVAWNGNTYQVFVPTHGVNDSTSKEFDSIQNKIGKCLSSSKYLYKIKGYKASKKIAYHVGKYYYLCKIKG